MRDDVDRDAVEALRNASEREIARRWIALIREELATAPTADMHAAMQVGDDRG